MKIIWFSEIKWSYLRTRKQHILANFNDSDEILFIEPISFNLKNKFNISIEKNIKYITIPQLQNSDIIFLNYLIHFLPVKSLIKIISTFFMNRLLKKIKFKPDIIITSNVFWIDYLEKFKNKHRLNIIYDCNDNPLAFPNSSNKNIYFDRTLNHSDLIVVPFKSYKKFIPQKYQNQITVISNGVDSNLINSKLKKINIFKIDSSVIMYIGSIDTRINFKLLEKTITNLNKFNFVFIGDIKRQVKFKFKNIIKHSNVNHLSSINYREIGSYLKYAQVCIIPFKKNKLSKFILPNKIFEYSVLEKPFVLTNFNDDLRELSSDLLIANNDEEFSKLIASQIKNPYDTSKLKDFALNFEWKKISDQYRKLISKIIQN